MYACACSLHILNKWPCVIAHYWSTQTSTHRHVCNSYNSCETTDNNFKALEFLVHSVANEDVKEKKKRGHFVYVKYRW